MKSQFDRLSDRSTVTWKTEGMKALGMIAGYVSLTYQVYILGTMTAPEVWSLLEEQFNRNTVKNRFIVTKKLYNFKIEPGTKFTTHVDKFKEMSCRWRRLALDETRQLVLLLGSLTEEYKMINPAFENTPNITLAYAIQSLAGDQASDEFATKKKDYDKRRFPDTAFYCKKEWTQ
ncbi:LOW QUALITY PROTEIN: hypothetical protein PHMEG_0007570 [Phytophthora megakarya]|uniref:Polyprotein n=1 Tax=Phytophthora megakarya TaxID=4795 RepID=A0A225WLP6_9STRA|nr:LOW QUALITY PROTEIN: hypothetical protein PHMEG_0007570 [Phytophthora megakarya]